MTSVPRFVKAGAQCVFGNWNINDEQNHGTGSAAGAEAGMSNLEYVQELCGTDAVGWICEQLASELDSRDKRIEELEIQLMACSDGAAMEAMHKDKRIEELEAALRDVIHYANPRHTSTREKAVREGVILSGSLKHYEIMPHIIHQAQAALEGSDE